MLSSSGGDPDGAGEVCLKSTSSGGGLMAVRRHSPGWMVRIFSMLTRPTACALFIFFAHGLRLISPACSTGALTQLYAGTTADAGAINGKVRSSHPLDLCCLVLTIDSLVVSRAVGKDPQVQSEGGRRCDAGEAPRLAGGAGAEVLTGGLIGRSLQMPWFYFTRPLSSMSSLGLVLCIESWRGRGIRLGLKSAHTIAAIRGLWGKVEHSLYSLALNFH